MVSGQLEFGVDRRVGHGVGGDVVGRGHDPVLVEIFLVFLRRGGDPVEVGHVADIRQAEPTPRGDGQVVGVLGDVKGQFPALALDRLEVQPVQAAAHIAVFAGLLFGIEHHAPVIRAVSVHSGLGHLEVLDVALLQHDSLAVREHAVHLKVKHLDGPVALAAVLRFAQRQEAGAVALVHGPVVHLRLGIAAAHGAAHLGAHVVLAHAAFHILICEALGARVILDQGRAASVERNQFKGGDAIGRVFPAVGDLVKVILLGIGDAAEGTEDLNARALGHAILLERLGPGNLRIVDGIVVIHVPVRPALMTAGIHHGLRHHQEVIHEFVV